MLIIMGGTLGVRDPLAAGAGRCMGTTILFGWMTDLYSRLKSVNEENKDWCGRTWLRWWEPWSWVTRCSFTSLGTCCTRSCGCWPFAATTTPSKALASGCPTLCTASSTAPSRRLRSLASCSSCCRRCPGPSLYAWGELVYIVLSFAAKAQMGIIVVNQALVEGAIYDDLLFREADPAKTTCADLGLRSTHI